MLLDKDRIFSNLYGRQDFRLEAAKKRGAWNSTKELMQFGPERDLRPDQGLGPAWPWRRWLPDRAQMDVHARRS